MKENSLSYEQNVLQSLVNSAHAFLKFPDFKQSARFAYDCCKNLIGSTAGYVALLSADESQNELLFLDMGDLPCCLDPNEPMPIRGFRANAYSSGNVVYENNFQQSEWLQYLPDGHGLLDNVMFAPLVIDNKSVGIFGFANKPEGFSEDDALIARAFAEMTAIALLQKRTFEHSETNAQHLSALMQTAHDAIITIDQQGDISFWNKAAENIFGYKSAEMVGKSCQKIIPEQYKKMHNEAFAYAVNTGVSKLAGRIVEVEALRKNSEIFPAELSISKWEVDGTVFFTGILRDITIRKKMEREIVEAEKRLREVFKGMKGGGGIYKAVNDGDDFVFIDYHRPELQELSDDNGDLREKSILEVFPASKEYGLFDVFQRVWKTGKPEIHPVKIYDGDEITGWRENYVYKLPTGEIVSLYEDFTEKKRIERELQTSEALFRTIFETCPDPININRLEDGKFIKINDKFVQLTGFEKNEIIGKTALDINIWKNLDKRKQFFSKLYNDGQVRDFEADFSYKDGSFITAQVSAELISYQNEPHLLAVTKDITELKKAEKALQLAHEKLRNKYKIKGAALKESQINYQMVADYTYDWELWTNLDSTYRYVSPACERITGYKANQFIENQSLLREIIVPEDKEIWDKHHKESHKGIGLRELQFRIKRSDGEIRWIEHACQPVFTEENEFLGFRASNRDITARRLAEQKLQDSEENLKKAQEVAHIGSWKLDLHEKNLIWSDENYRIFGVPIGTRMSYEKFIKIVHPEDRDYVNEKWSASIKGEPYDIEHRLLVNNEAKWVREKAELRFDTKGNPISGVGTTQDITKRKLAEVARQETEKELRILSAQLLSAEERERKRIAGDIHDSIGQVLSAIKFSVENSLAAINNESVSSAIEMLENLIPLTKQSIEEVRRIIMDLRPSTLDDLGLTATISWFCREFESIYSDIQIAKEIHIEETDISPTLKTVIYRIMQEALNNAAKHSRTDIIRLHLMQNKDELELLVEDTGVGFSLDEVQSRNVNLKGMGLGSMKERAQLSGGNFSIRSTAGIGTRINVSWPKEVCCIDQE
ncbi:PAS domain S-box protein [Thermodesulfobacteriota bacterium]